MNKKLFASALTLAMLSSMLAVLPVFAVPPNGGVLHFVPDPVALTGASVGYEMWVQVTIDNINPLGPGVGGVQVRVYTSDIGIVKFVAARLPIGHFMDPDGSAELESNLWKVTNPRNSSDGSYAECATTFYDMALAISHSDAPIYAAGVIMEVKIRVMAEAPKYGSVSATFSFDDGNTVIGDPIGGALDRDISDTGAYSNTWAPPSTLPHLEVSPTSNVLDTLDAEFDLNIVMKNVVAGWELVGFNFKLDYNATLLEIVSVSNGTFLEGFAGPPNGGMFYIPPVNGPDYIITGAMILPDDFGVYHAPFPTGNGVVYTIRFKGILQGVYPTTYSCALNLDDSWVDFGDKNGVAIPKDPSVDGTYTMKPKMPVAMGKVIDVYTCNYPFPWGAQGVANETSGEFMFSDMFWPQKEVCLCANVTYNGWPVQNKDVAFEVRAANGTIMTVLVDRTDENGFANVSFRMNWPCDNPESLFGIWKVTATVDIACDVVTDYFYFKYDYLVHIWKVTTDKDDYGHCEWMNVTVEFGSRKILPLVSGDVLITVTLHDELNYPLVTGTVSFTQTLDFEECTIEDFWACTYKNYTGMVRLHIDKSVVAGIATLHVCALSNWPELGGVALCEERTNDEIITIVPFWA